MLAKTLQPSPSARPTHRDAGSWLPGVVVGAGGARRFRLYRPPAPGFGGRLPLMVMLHGCAQDADGFAASTRMNPIARRAGFFVLYPEQDRMANAQGCWNWFDTRTGRAQGEATLILRAIDQVCLLHPVDPSRVAIVGLSAGASMAALLATLHPGRFKALVMHSGIPPGIANSRLSALGAMQGRAANLPLRTPPDALRPALPPLLVLHGTADAVVSPQNAQVAAGAWANAAGAQACKARTVQRGQRYPMTITDFIHKGRTVTTLVTVDGLAHAWSGGAPSKPYSDAQGPDASRMAWTFAARQFRAGA